MSYLDNYIWKILNYGCNPKLFFIETETTNFINKLPQNISNEDNKKKMMGKKKFLI